MGSINISSQSESGNRFYWYNVNVIFTIPQISKNKEADDKLSEDQGELDDTSSRRVDAVYQGKIYIEVMLAADKTTCDFYGNGTLDYLLNTANLVIAAIRHCDFVNVHQKTLQSNPYDSY